MNEMRTVSKIHRVLTAASTRVKKKELGDNKQHSHSEWRSSRLWALLKRVGLRMGLWVGLRRGA